MKRFIPCFLLVLIPVVYAQDNTVSKEHKLSEKYEAAVARMEESSKTNPPPVGCTMFVGSSTWTGWGKTFDDDFKGMNAVNRGFGGSTIPDWLIAVDRIVTPYKPSRILFFCGTNDIARKQEPERVFENFKTLLKKLRADNPDCKVYFVSAAKVHSRKQYWEKYDIYNNAVRELCRNDKNLFYIDTNAAMADENGVVKEELYKEDRLHLNRKGQEVWIPVLRKAVLNENGQP